MFGSAMTLFSQRLDALFYLRFAAGLGLQTRELITGAC